MADLIYQVKLGESRLYDWCVASVADYAGRIGSDHVVQTEPILKISPNPLRSGRSLSATGKYGGFLPIFEKENALARLGQYDRVAVIDADVFVREDAPSIFDQLGSADFAGVRERDLPSTPAHRKKIQTYSRIFKAIRCDWHFTTDGVADFMNMGVMLMGKGVRHYLRGQTPREFLHRHEFRDFVDGVGPFKWSTDQLLLNFWVKSSGMAVKSLDWRWNCLYGAVPDDKLQKAWFLHFYLRDHLPERGENVEELAERISKNNQADR